VTGIILSPFSLCVRGNSALFAFLPLCDDGHKLVFQRLKKISQAALQTALSLAMPAPRRFLRGKVGKPMDERIESFLRDVLALEGEIWNLLRQGVRRHLAICEEQFRDAETNKRMKDRAAQACRTLCRARVAEEMRRCKGTSTAKHLKVVLSIIDTAALSQSNDD
jgi:hypothetical protein